jgi:hypothetical protein
MQKLSQSHFFAKSSPFTIIVDFNIKKYYALNLQLHH